jgi:hypothetical protein
MNRIILISCISLFFGINANSQEISNVFAKSGKIFIQYSNGISKEIVSIGNNSILEIPKSKKFVIYKRLEKATAHPGQEGGLSFDQVSIHSFDLVANRDKLLFTTCIDGDGGTIPDYANSDIYPFDNLCGLENTLLSPDGKLLFFQTNAWVVCPAVHIYNLETNKIIFFKAGWLNKITSEGIEVGVTGIDYENKGGSFESKGRYTQICLFNFNGDLIREITPKEH